MHFLKLHKNSSSLYKRNHDHDGVCIPYLDKQGFSPFYFSIFSLVLVSIEKINQTLKTVFDRNFKHLKVYQKYSTTPHIFNFLLEI